MRSKNSFWKIECAYCNEVDKVYYSLQAFFMHLLSLISKIQLTAYVLSAGRADDADRDTLIHKSQELSFRLTESAHIAGSTATYTVAIAWVCRKSWSSLFGPSGIRVAGRQAEQLPGQRDFLHLFLLQYIELNHKNFCNLQIKYKIL